MGGLIPQQFIDELLAKTDIVNFIDSYVPLKKQGTSHAACCPFHDEKTPSFNVIAKKQFYHCFGCGVSGNVISFAMSYLNQDFPEAIETLAARAGLEVPKDSQSTRSHTKSLPLYELLDKIAAFYANKLHTTGLTAASYLANRGVSAEVIKRYQIGYAPKGWHALKEPFKAHLNALITTGMLVLKDDKSTYDRYRHRIMFPIHDRHGRLIGFGGRAIEPDQKPKYLNSPETVIFQKNRELYGLHQVLEAHKNPDHVLIVEGYMDVIALAEHGFSNAVATLGTATSTYHVQLLSKHTKTLVFCFDGDAAGMKAAKKALENTLPMLDGSLNAQFIFLPEGEDPDSLVRKEGFEAFSKRIKQATPLHEHLFQMLTKQLDMTSLAGRSQLLDAIAPFWQKIPDGPYKQLLLDELARLSHLDADRIEKTLGTNQTEVPKVVAASALKRTPIRLATALLLQNPELYTATHAELPDASELVQPNQKVLKKLMEHLANKPNSNTATLIELFRETPLFDAINKLAAWHHQVPMIALDTEFVETVLFLTKQTETREVEQLIEKARNQGLSEAEQKKLQAMLKNRHRLSETE